MLSHIHHQDWIDIIALNVYEGTMLELNFDILHFARKASVAQVIADQLSDKILVGVHDQVPMGGWHCHHQWTLTGEAIQDHPKEASGDAQEKGQRWQQHTSCAGAQKTAGFALRARAVGVVSAKMGTGFATRMRFKLAIETGRKTLQLRIDR